MNSMNRGQVPFRQEALRICFEMFDFSAKQKMQTTMYKQ